MRDTVEAANGDTEQIMLTVIPLAVDIASDTLVRWGVKKDLYGKGFLDVMKVLQKLAGADEFMAFDMCVPTLAIGACDVRVQARVMPARVAGTCSRRNSAHLRRARTRPLGAQRARKRSGARSEPCLPRAHPSK